MHEMPRDTQTLTPDSRPAFVNYRGGQPQVVVAPVSSVQEVRVDVSRSQPGERTVALRTKLSSTAGHWFDRRPNAEATTRTVDSIETANIPPEVKLRTIILLLASVDADLQELEVARERLILLKEDLSSDQQAKTPDLQ